MSSELKVTFSDKMNKYQYDGHANHIPLPSMAKGKGKLWLGDRDSCSMVQLKHRNIKSVVNAQGDMHGLSKEGKCREGGMVMHHRLQPDSCSTYFSLALILSKVILN